MSSESECQCTNDEGCVSAFDSLLAKSRNVFLSSCHIYIFQHEESCKLRRTHYIVEPSFSMIQFFITICHIFLSVYASSSFMKRRRLPAVYKDKTQITRAIIGCYF